VPFLQSGHSGVNRLIAAVAGGVGLAFTGGHATQPLRSAAAPTTSTTHSGDSLAPQPQLNKPNPRGTGFFSPSDGEKSRPFKPAPCPANASQPSNATGQYCGPAPHAGDGFGPGGECTGQETRPPCGPGAMIGMYYAYTLPQRCNGLIIFDGRRWYATLTPPTPEPDIDVWIQLESTNAVRWISPAGSVEFVPDVGQAAPSCRR
jgi:hypothetical protein